MKKLNKKKKGFTLIELVIVLAVLAIIALIAIPNFTKVRNDSLIKADKRTGEQIKKITLMAIANENIKVPTPSSQASEVEIKFPNDTLTITGGIYDNGSSDYATMLKEINAPQVNGEESYKVKIDVGGNVTVYYGTGATLSE